MATKQASKKAATKVAGSKGPSLYGAMAKKLLEKGKKAVKAAVERVRLDKVSYHPLLELTPTMSSVVESLRKLATTARGSTLMDCRARLEEREPEWKAFVGDVARRGIVEPLTVVKNPAGGWWVVDGRNRTCAGREAGLVDAPVRVTTEEPEAVILGSLAARRHVSKELLAFVGLECHRYLIGDGEKGRPAKAETEGAEKPQSLRFSTLAELSESIGVSLRTVETAARIHRMFAGSKKVRAKWEWRLYAGTSFQGILAGDAADKQPGNGGATDGASVAVRKFFLGFAGRVRKHWAALEEEGLEALAAVEVEAKAALAGLPDGAWEWVVEAAADRAACMMEGGAE